MTSTTDDTNYMQPILPPVQYAPCLSSALSVTHRVHPDPAQVAAALLPADRAEPLTLLQAHFDILQSIHILSKKLTRTISGAAAKGII